MPWVLVCPVIYSQHLCLKNACSSGSSTSLPFTPAYTSLRVLFLNLSSRIFTYFSNTASREKEKTLILSLTWIFKYKRVVQHSILGSMMILLINFKRKMFIPKLIVVVFLALLTQPHDFSQWYHIWSKSGIIVLFFLDEKANYLSIYVGIIKGRLLCFGEFTVDIHCS